MMRRREFITLLGGAAAAWPLAARAQQGERVRRIGALMTLAADDPEGQGRLRAFVQELQQLGWIDGRNVQIDLCWGEAMQSVTVGTQSESLPRCSTVPAVSFNEGFYKVALTCVFEARLHRATS